MRSFLLPLLSASLCSTSVLGSDPALPSVWTLDAAIEQASRANPDARMAEAKVESSHALQEQAAAAGLPRLEVRASYVQTTNPMQAFGAILSQGTFDSSINFNAPGQLDALTAGLYARYALFTGGRVSGTRHAASSSAEAAVYDREAALNGLAVEVVRAYHQIRRAGEAVSALESALRSLDENLRMGLLREEAGQLLRTERLNLQVQRSQTDQQLLAARHQRSLAERQFAFLLGLEPGAAIRLADTDLSVRRLAVPGVLRPEQRPELAAMKRRVTSAERMVRVARGGRLPNVGVFAGVQSDHGWRRRGDGESWSAGLSAELPVFDGFETRGRIRNAQSEAAFTREQMRKLEQAVALELEKSRLNYELARAQVAVSDQQLLQAEESARLSRERFAAGSLLSAELIGVETRLTEALVRRSVNLAAEQIAIAELRRAAGHPILD